uniref:Glucosamine-6-phosphate deaminase n=1 Tax=uncultured Nocardioidaceae bacterium TaxID=253824 RepID=A0A6J4L6H8_9ACTN|nr:MAG: Glucosamine-6-phosphate deaminase [uncultured Nocardioidaceae bacterium]
MEVVPVPTTGDIGRLVADAIEHLVRERPDAVLGLATGSSPLPVYQELVARHRAGTGPAYARVRAFLLDEYVGLAPEDTRSFRATIARELTDALDIDPANVLAPDVDGPDLPGAGRRYEEAVASAGGIALQLLGIGGDGHLAFNEPGSSLASRTRLKTLTARTRTDNARFFGDADDVPRHVLTQGLGTVLDAGHLVLVASGEAKSSAIAAAVEGPVSASCPASVLQLHPRATVVVDEAAASGLTRLDYYREVYAGKPDWQRPI